MKKQQASQQTCVTPQSSSQPTLTSGLPITPSSNQPQSDTQDYINHYHQMKMYTENQQKMMYQQSNTHRNALPSPHTGDSS